MLARASSDAGTRLRRSKSTSSAHRPAPPAAEPLDPDVAQRQALAAATAAFSRQTAQNVADSRAKRGLEVTRSKSSASRKSLSSQGSHFPPRESSFRSQNPAHPGNHANTKVPVRRSTMDMHQKLPPFPSPVDDTHRARPLSAQLGNTLSKDSRPSTQPKPGRQTAASSITSQQIRKARSMYYASSIQTGSPIARPPAKYLAAPAATSDSLEPTFTLDGSQTRSAGPSPLSSHRIPVTIAPNETVDKARDVYLQTFQQRSIKNKPSLFLAPFRKRQHETRDHNTQTVPTPALVTPGFHQMPAESGADVSLAEFLPRPEKSDKRSFSGSIKSKIRRVFKRNSSRVPTLPVQQIAASRDYSEMNGVSSACVSGSGFEIPSPDNDILERVRSRNSSIEENHLASARVGSPDSGNESIQSLQCHTAISQTSASASRVTSWGTTSTGDTLTQRALKRLTVIHEAKDSIGSEADRLANLSTHEAHSPLPTFTAFRDPMPVESQTGEPSPYINPKRIFSALMREIDISKSTPPQASLVARTPAAEDGLLESSEPKGIRLSSSSESRPLSARPATSAGSRVPGKKSSIRSFGRALRSTIRQVTPGENRSSPHPHLLDIKHQPAGKSQNDGRTPRSNTPSTSLETEDEPRTAMSRDGGVEPGAVARR